MFTGTSEFSSRPFEIRQWSHLGGIRPNALIEGPRDVEYYISQYDGEIAFTDRYI